MIRFVFKRIQIFSVYNTSCISYQLWMRRYCLVRWVSEWLLFNAKLAIFQLYHDEAYWWFKSIFTVNIYFLFLLIICRKFIYVVYNQRRKRGWGGRGWKVGWAQASWRNLKVTWRCKLWKRTGKLESGDKHWKWTGRGVNFKRGRERGEASFKSDKQKTIIKKVISFRFKNHPIEKF